MIRLLDLNDVSYLHSQTIYHSVAYCTTADSVGTIILLRPREPYVCIGYHQLLEREVDVVYCNRKGIPIIRREVGGGTVYLDKNQLFFQCIFPKDQVPLRIDSLYQKFLQPAVNTYRALGVKAHYQPVNDIQVDGKKICGTGAGSIEEAAVVVGNIMFDFDYREMSRVLQVPSEKFRDTVYDSMQIYVSSLQRELGYLPDMEEVKRILIKEFEKVLGITFSPGDLTSDEQRMLRDIDRRFTDPDWLYEKGGKIDKGLKIATGVTVIESTCQAPGGLIRIIIRLKGDTIDEIVITGDSAFQQREDFRLLEDQLMGQPLVADSVSKTVESFYRIKDFHPPAVRPEDMVRAIMGVKN